MTGKLFVDRMIYIVSSDEYPYRTPRGIELLWFSVLTLHMLTARIATVLRYSAPGASREEMAYGPI